MTTVGLIILVIVCAAGIAYIIGFACAVAQLLNGLASLPSPHCHATNAHQPTGRHLGKNDNVVTCQECGGNKYVIKSLGPGFGPALAPLPCQTCHGTGHVGSNYKCYKQTPVTTKPNKNKTAGPKLKIIRRIRHFINSLIVKVGGNFHNSIKRLLASLKGTSSLPNRKNSLSSQQCIYASPKDITAHRAAKAKISAGKINSLLEACAKSAVAAAPFNKNNEDNALTEKSMAD